MAGLTVTPIKIFCRQNKSRINNTLGHAALRIKRKISSGRPRSVPVANTPNTANRNVLSVGSGKRRGRPPGSKKKMVVCNSGKDTVERTVAATDTRLTDFDDGSQGQSTSDRTECSQEDSIELHSRDNAPPFWQPPGDANSRRLLDRVSITDVTINAFTITVRESSSVDGFFKPDVTDGLLST